MGPNGEKTAGQANITEYNGTDLVSFTVSSRGPSASYKAIRDVDSIKDEIKQKINRGNVLVREEGLRLVGSKSGAQRIDQICSIYDYLVGNWTYVSDWKGLDEFQYSNYSLKMGREVGSSGKGDCDDFSILLASLVESIGGTPRIVFAYSPSGGHAYAEVYLGKNSNKDVDRMLRWLRTAYSVNDVNLHQDLKNGDVWLNMDWWTDPDGANRPGGPFYQAKTHIPMYIQGDEDKTPLTSIENLLPLPLFNFSPTTPEVDDVVSFDASGSIDPDGKIVDYEWDFGDGENARGVAKLMCKHVYTSSGAFKANLTLTDSEGEKSTITSEINVIEPLPDAIGTYSPAEPEVSDVITFDASQSKDKKWPIIDYEWDFGDGYSGNGESIDHKFMRSRTFTVKLTVTNEKGIKNSSLIKVNVSQEVDAAEVYRQNIFRQAANATVNQQNTFNQLGLSESTVQINQQNTIQQSEPAENIIQANQQSTIDLAQDYQTYHVNENGLADYKTIGGAVSAAKDNDVIIIEPGFYKEEIFLDKDFKLVTNIPGLDMFGNGRTYIVDKEGLANFNTINEALSSANNGDTIYIKPGNYSEDIFINKNIALARLLGETRPIILNCSITISPV